MINEDCISRQAAIDAIWDGTNMDIYTREVKECLEALPPVTPAEDDPDTNVGEYINREDALMCLTGEWTELTDDVIHRFIRRIKALPLSVIPAEKMGEWIKCGDIWKCSRCHELSCCKANFCPDCGAKMRRLKDDSKKAI